MRNLRIKNGSISVDSGIDAVASSVEQRVRLIRDEWFMDLDAGVPLDEVIRERDISLGSALIVDEMYKVPDVSLVNVSSLKIDSETRRIELEANVSTETDQFSTNITVG